MSRSIAALFTLVLALVLVAGAGPADALSPRGKTILDRFDQKREGWQLKPLIEMVPDRGDAQARRRVALGKAKRLIDDAAVLHNSLDRLLQPMPAEDRNDPRYKAAVKWLADLAAQIESWKKERDDLLAAERQAGEEQKQVSAAYKAEAEQHKDLLLALNQASLQLDHIAKKGAAVEPLSIQHRPTEILDRAALLDQAVLGEGRLDQMATNCKEKYIKLPEGWAPRCQEAVFAHKIAEAYKERAAVVLAAYQQALEARSCPAGSARSKAVEKGLAAAFKATYGKEYQAYHVRQDGPVTTETGIGTLTESANAFVCYKKHTATGDQCGIWEIGFVRHRAGRGPWSKWEHSGNNGPGAELTCAKAKSGK